MLLVTPEKFSSKKEKLREVVSSLSIVSVLFLLNAWPSCGFDIYPDLMLSVIYYWTVFHPTPLLMGTLFFSGLMEDIFSNTLMGMTPLLWLTLSFLVLTQRRFLMGKDFSLIWMIYAGSAFSIFVLKWWLLGLTSGAFLPFKPVFFSYLLSVGSYPLVAFLTDYCFRSSHAT